MAKVSPDGILLRLLPSNTDDIVGTLSRVLRTRDPAARAEVGRAAMATLATPIDVAASYFEQQICARAPAPDLPIIFVCGPGCSGTSRVVSYERFCADPNVLLDRLSRVVINRPHQRLTDADRAAIRVSSRRMVDDPTFRDDSGHL